MSGMLAVSVISCRKVMTCMSISLLNNSPQKKVQVCTVKDTHKTNTPTQQTVRKQRSLAHSSISIVTFGCVNNARQSLARLLNYSAGERIARYKVPAQRHRDQICPATTHQHRQTWKDMQSQQDHPSSVCSATALV